MTVGEEEDDGEDVLSSHPSEEWVEIKMNDVM